LSAKKATINLIYFKYFFETRKAIGTVSGLCREEQSLTSPPACLASSIYRFKRFRYQPHPLPGSLSMAFAFPKSLGTHRRDTIFSAW
jgi:hypothetical protein